MITKDILEKKIQELEALAVEIEVKGLKLFQEAPTHSIQVSPHSSRREAYWDTLPENLRPLQREIVRSYQTWYSIASQLVIELSP